MGFDSGNDKTLSSLVVVGGTYEPWLATLEQAGWHCHRCYDLRAAQSLLQDIGPCIGIVDLSHDDFSLNGVASLVNRNKQVRWLALVRENQLNNEAICQFIVSFCIDYFTSPVPNSQLMSTIGHQLGMLRLERQVWPQLGDHSDMGLEGASPAMKKLRDQVRRVAPTDVSVLIAGESGTGKELVAQAVHHASTRAKARFESIKCSALADEQMQQALLGDEHSHGKIRQCHKGTLFFDEIGDLPLHLQGHLLHLLQEGTLDISHDKYEHDLDVRVIASTHMDLEKRVAEGLFREDLYYRLNVLRINMPSLKDRQPDVPDLAEYFLLKFARQYNTQARTFSDEAKRVLSSYSWPGNVRELINQVKRAVLLADHLVIEAEHLDLPRQGDYKQSLRKIREESERDALIAVLEENKGQVSAAAKELGVSRATMYRLLNKHNLIPSPRTFRQ
ncbi:MULTISPECIES: sigma-54 dependent transcriptional regulator [Salinivibrio]|uniref:Sigma-54-dependent Fis family transcriptional regulator n=1 Tax=Salinivibrio siamensis TaxID=414286 RepID=A0ABX3K669_9GAMM|nr:MULTISPECIES: sigma-54 dependent transcriptional regulator [Salinivibrio]KKA44265.1 Fis family transcriptional regulator [Salinivibrio sp. KP-1]MPS33197.1 sigma-54-dependent Fis family transcriptional regulator [Salinivibrio sp. VYel7]MPX91289.1 sigma-54-dependent Fis family transcriptional regulator [Salinivibrio sp. VYel1]MPX94582.1 sigma-54-dependent Fis family transcriptional regulator [Salinivibrio sp. VYel9]MPX97381.1 sigma-54-dependent Fis family transcriptional regulator [Salinivibr